MQINPIKNCEPLYSARVFLESNRYGSSMTLEDTPDTADSSIWNDKGSTTVPEKIREALDVGKGNELKWVADSDDDHVKVYKNS